VYGMPPWLSAVLPSSMVFAAGLVLLRRGS